MKKLIVFAMLLVLGACSTTSSENGAGYQKITPDEFQALIEKQDEFVLVDVRSEEEYNEGHINGAKLIPLNTLVTEAKTVLPELDQLIIVYCRTGNRSKEAADLLIGEGYKNVYDLGGLNSYPYDLVK